MDVLRDEAQTLLQQSVTAAVTRLAPFATVRAWVDREDLTAADRLAVEQGWTGLGLPEDLGGEGGGVQELAVVAEQLGAGAVPWDLMLATVLVTPLLAAADDAGRELAAGAAGGTTPVVLCVDARDPGAVPPVEVDGDRCTGVVPHVLGAAAAAQLVVALPHVDGEVELLTVPRDADGVTVTPRRFVDRTRSLADVALTGAVGRSLGHVPAAALTRLSDTATVLSCADTLGATSRMLQMTTSYVHERRQFGVAVGSFQAVKHLAAQMLVDVEGIRSAVQYAAWAVGAETAEASLHAAVAGAFSSQAGPTVADRALFLHGAIGYTWEHDLQLLFKRAKSNAALFGSTDTHRERISAGLGCPAP